MRKYAVVSLVLLAAGCGNQFLYLADAETGRVTSVPASLSGPCNIRNSADLDAVEFTLIAVENARRLGLSRAEVFFSGLQGMNLTTMSGESLACIEAILDHVYGPFARFEMQEESSPPHGDGATRCPG